jgi:N-acetylglucosaminyl-diphospho-decaprenol L-rhamnosyltransferase
VANVKFSVVIVNYDSWYYTLRCIESLGATGYGDFEVVVVDNDRLAVPDELPRAVRLIRNPENLGFARACNAGIEASGGELVVLINPDTLVERTPNGRTFFEEFEDFFERHPEAGVAGPRIVDGAGALQLSASTELNFASALLGRTSLLVRSFPKNPLVKRLFPAADDGSGPTRVDWVSGACVVIRRQTLKEIGPLDERFFMYFEDADLCRRVREAGWLVYYLPQAEVLHYTGASSRSRLRAIWNLHKSAFLYHRKHDPHGPAQLYSLLVLLGLCARALAKLWASVVESRRS